MITAILEQLANHQDLDDTQTTMAMTALMDGSLSEAQAASLLMGLRTKGETIAEIASCARVMRHFALPVHVASHLQPQLIDIVGTGGDGAHTMNISTCAAFVVASLGVPVAKHGNRSVSSKCGAADVLESLGVNLSLTPDQVSQCVENVGIGFMFAPNHHPAMKNVVPIRRAMGIRTIFNILGPLTNPAQVRRMLLGVYSEHLVEPIANVLIRLGVDRAMVVWGHNGVDELSVSTHTTIAQIINGTLTLDKFSPERANLTVHHDISALAVTNITEAKAKLLAVLDGVTGVSADMVALNAGAALYVAEKTESIQEGVAIAKQQLGNGQAKAKLEAFVQYTQSFS